MRVGLFFLRLSLQFASSQIREFENGRVRNISNILKQLVNI